MVGVDDEAMQKAGERVAELGGGWGVVDEEGRRTELPFELAGVCSDRPPEATAKGMDAVSQTMQELGVSVDSPLLAVATLSSVGVPSLKLTFSGYVDVLDGRVKGHSVQ